MPAAVKFAFSFARWKDWTLGIRNLVAYVTTWIGLVMAGLIGWKDAFYARLLASEPIKESRPPKVPHKIPGEFREDLPTFQASEVAKHADFDKEIWVVFKHGVYDITKYEDRHPGGKAILGEAAGRSVETSWKVYAFHLEPRVLRILQKYRIGNLAENTSVPMSDVEDNADPYVADPQRDSRLVVHSHKPFCAEPPTDVLISQYLTPNELFYVRNHLPVPLVEPSEYELKVTGMEIQEKLFTLDELKSFPKQKFITTIMCEGNRRAEMSQVKKIRGTIWGTSAVGNAEWSGVRLLDVLKSLRWNPETTKVAHIQLEGRDKDPSGVPYGCSVPLKTALNSDILLAYEMNREPIPRDHGYPIRAVVPGVAGARNVKWLSKIVLSDHESNTHWQQKDYGSVWQKEEHVSTSLDLAPAVQEMPVTSAICNVRDGDTVALVDGKLKLKGYAFCGGGRKVLRVELTADSGDTWHAAQREPLHEVENSIWTLWTADLPIDAAPGEEVEIWVKAVDDCFNSQPEKFRNIWNMRGVVCNAYNQVKVKIST